MQAPHLTTVGAAAKEILSEIRVKKDPLTVLAELNKKLPQKSAIKDGSGGLRVLQKDDVKDLLEEMAAKSCGQPKFFVDRKAKQLKDDEQARRDAELEKLRQEKAEKSAAIKLQKHKDQASSGNANINLKEYSEKNLRLLGSEHAKKINVAMAAAAYDPQTQRYFVGKSGEGHKNGTGNVPAGIWNSIKTDVDVTDNAFGTNCAEVDCLVKLFDARLAAHNNVQDLKGVVFVAYTGGAADSRGPCHSCNGWVHKHLGSCLKAQV